jgi:hypothetical protein
LTAKLVIPSAVSAQHFIDQALPALTSSTTQAVSVYAKGGGYTWVMIQTIDKAGAVAARSWVNLSTGVVGAVAAEHAVVVRPSANGFYRVLVTWTSSVGATTPTCRFYPTNANSAITITGDGTSGVYLWGMQFEADKPACSAYVRTTTSTASRAAGVLSYPVSPAPWDAFTVAGWFWAGVNPAQRLFVCSGGIGISTADWYLSTNAAANDTLLLTYIDPAASIQTFSSGVVSGLNVTTGWNFLALTYHRGTTTARIYSGASATLRATSTAVSIRTPYAGTFCLGANIDLATPLNGLIGPVWMLPYEATQAQLAALAGLATAPPALPYLRATGDLVRSIPVNVLGKVEGSDLTPVGTAAGLQMYESVRYGVEEVP